MVRMVPTVIVLSTLLVSGTMVSQIAQANDEAALIKKGRAKAQGCTRCHGRNGIREAAERAGVKSVALFAREELVAFKSGTRSHPIMSAVAQTLSTDDIDLIALWLESVR